MALFILSSGFSGVASATAFTKEGSYTLPDAMLKKTFSKGKMYYWKVVAFEEESVVAGESKMQSFSFK